MKVCLELDMDMPQSCEECRFFQEDKVYHAYGCFATMHIDTRPKPDNRAWDCPLSEIQVVEVNAT